MIFECNAIDALRIEVRKYMSEKRYKHTLCVERMAEYIGEHCLPDKVAALKCAALLHDIAKELDADQLLKILGEKDLFKKDQMLMK